MNSIKEFQRAWNKHKGIDDRKITVKSHFIWDKESKIFKADYYTYYFYGGGTTVSFYYHYCLKIDVHIDEIERID